MKKDGILCAAVMFFALLAGNSWAGDVAVWKRHPIVTAPYLAQAPKIDGQVERAEWQAAATLGLLKVEPEGAAGEQRQTVYVGYDDANLYVGFQLERPAGALVPQMPAEAGHVDDWRAGDQVELCLDVGHTHTTYYNFVLYANGAFGEGQGKPGVDRNWNVPWRQAASLTPRGWQGEMAIPFASLGLAGAPQASETWGLDFLDNRKTPSRLLAYWGFRGPQNKKFENFGHLRFGARDAPAARFLCAGDAGQDKLAVQFDVVNATGRPVKVDAEVELLRRKAAAGGGPKSYYENIESGGEYDRTQVEFEKSTKLEPLVAETLRFYEPVAGGRISVQPEVPGGQRRAVGLLVPGGPGEYLVVYRFQTAGGDPLLAGVQPIRSESPLALAVEPYWLHAQVVDVRADLRKIAGSGKSVAAFALVDAAKKTLCAQKREVRLPAAEVTASLPTADLAPGFYAIEVTLQDAEGNALARSQQALEKPAAPAWHGNALGKRDVARPWTPLAAGPDGLVTMWGRTYRLGQVLPTSITSAGDELLAAPMRIDFVREGRALPWTVKEFCLRESTPGKVVYGVAMENESLRAAGTLSVEFDGLAWHELLVSPRGGPVPVDRAEIALDLGAKHMTLCGHHKFLADPVLDPQPPACALGGGPRLEPSLMPLSPYLWLGDESGGLALVVEGMRDWKVSQPNKVVEVAPGRAGEPVRLRAKFIDAPAVIDRPMHLEFGLQASPIRPRPREDVTHLVQLGGPSVEEDYYRQAAAAGTKVVIFHSGWKGNKGDEWGGWPCRPKRPEMRERLKQAIGLAHRYGLKVCLYTGWGVDAGSDEYKLFGLEMTRRPIENSGFGTYRQAAGLAGAYADYMAYAIADLVREYDADGVMWDSCSNLFTDQNLRIGNGWTDAEGRPRPTYPVRATRELFRRVYNLLHGELKDDGVVVNFGGSIWAVNAYADVFHRGEGTPMHVKALADAWDPLETFRADYAGRPFGLPYLAMNKNFKRLPMTVNKHHAVTLLHGCHTKAIRFGARELSYGVQAMPHQAIFQARAWLPFDGRTRSLFYYEQRAVQPEQSGLPASAFVSADARRALVVVSNLAAEPVASCPVKIDLAALGMDPARPTRLEDAVLGTPVELDAGQFSIDIEPERFRLLKLWQE